MRQIELHIDPVDADADGISLIASGVGAFSITFDGSLILDGIYTADGEKGSQLARKIGITSSGDDTGITFDLVGTDQDDKPQSESVTGANNDIAESTGYYKTLTSATTSGSTDGGVTVGTVDEFSTPTIPIDTYNTDPATISLERFSGVIDVSVEQSKSRIQYTDVIVYYAGPSSLQGQTSQSTDELNDHVSAFRVIGNSYTSAGELRVICNQNRSI